MQSLILLVLMLIPAEICYAQSYCGNNFYNDTRGSVRSPRYPRNYLPYSNCTYRIQASKLSRMALRLEILDLEFQSNCTYDWVQIGCVSHQVGLPRRFCGDNTAIETMIFSPCTQIQINFQSDSSVSGSGFSIDYRVTEIGCIRNCTPVSNSYGYICRCDSNQTNASLPTARPLPSCPSSCQLSSDTSFCICSRRAPTTTRSTCQPGCYQTRDFFGDPTCTCRNSTTTTVTCAPGCYRSTDWRGYSSCNCPSTTNRPLSCPYGCYADSDYWGNRYCNCPQSTQPPLWCSSGCTSAVDAYGSRYCNCPTTTQTPCFSPCYYTWDYTYDVSGRRICYCPTTTTNPPPTGCNGTFTETFGTITSPNYPNMYTKGIQCLQTIQVPMATSIRLRVIDLNVYYYSSTACGYEYIEITGCDGTYGVYCNSYSFPTTGLDFQCTESSIVTINFVSATSSSYTYRGFKLTYTANFGANCSDSGVYLSAGGTGLLTSPNFPNNFPSFGECYNYIFTDEDDVMIKVTFQQLRLEASSNCDKVSLMLTCQDDSKYSQEVCGNRIPKPMTFDCQVLQIRFKSNSTNLMTPRGYKMRYYGISKQTSTPSVGSLPKPEDERKGEHDITQSAKLGIGLGVGIGGFFLIILIVIIIILIVSNQRQAAKRDQHRLDDLAIICRNIIGSGPDAGGNIRFARSPYDEGFVNPMHVTHTTEHLPAYNSAPESLAETSSVGGYSIDKPKTKLVG